MSNIFKNTIIYKNNKNNLIVFKYKSQQMNSYVHNPNTKKCYNYCIIVFSLTFSS